MASTDRYRPPPARKQGADLGLVVGRPAGAQRQRPARAALGPLGEAARPRRRRGRRRPAPRRTSASLSGRRRTAGSASARSSAGRAGLAVMRISMARPGGSSSVFRRAFWPARQPLGVVDDRQLARRADRPRAPKRFSSRAWSMPISFCAPVAAGRSARRRAAGRDGCRPRPAGSRRIRRGVRSGRRTRAAPPAVAPAAPCRRPAAREEQRVRQAAGGEQSREPRPRGLMADARRQAHGWHAARTAASTARVHRRRPAASSRCVRQAAGAAGGEGVEAGADALVEGLLLGWKRSLSPRARCRPTRTGQSRSTVSAAPGRRAPRRRRAYQVEVEAAAVAL